VGSHPIQDGYIANRDIFYQDICNLQITSPDHYSDSEYSHV
jgi:hypothetical protein